MRFTFSVRAIAKKNGPPSRRVTSFDTLVGVLIPWCDDPLYARDTIGWPWRQRPSRPRPDAWADPRSLLADSRALGLKDAAGSCWWADRCFCPPTCRRVLSRFA